MLPISYLPPKTSFTSRKIPPKTITIVHNKNGKDYIKDEFVDFHVIRPSLFEIVRGLFYSIIKKY